MQRPSTATSPRCEPPTSYGAGRRRRPARWLSQLHQDPQGRRARPVAEPGFFEACHRRPLRPDHQRRVRLGCVAQPVSEEHNDSGQDDSGSVVTGRVVIPGGDGPELLDAVEEALHHVAVLVNHRIECGRTSSSTPLGLAVGLLIRPLRNGCPDPPSPQRPPGRRIGSRLCQPPPCRPSPRSGPTRRAGAGSPRPGQA